MLERAIKKLKAMQHTHHYVCEEDCWFSCPKSDDCCNSEYKDIPNGERPCLCGLDKRNAELQEVIDIITAFLQAIEQQ